MRISIITPVYNPPLERLRATMRSVKNQRHSDWEWVLVNDGSNDPEILGYLEELKNSDSRIQIHHRPNGGPSAARNFGTIVATGQYVTFLDADDELTPESLEESAAIITDTGCDVVVGYVQYVDAEIAKDHGPGAAATQLDQSSQLAYADYILSGVDRLGLVRSSRVKVKIGPVARFLKASIAKSVPFRKDLHLSEDTIWNLELAQYVNSMAVSDSIWYWYWVTHDSTSRGYRADAPAQTKLFFSVLDDVVRTSNWKMAPRSVFLRILGEVNRATRLYLARSECELSLCEKRQVLRELLREHELSDYVTFTNAFSAGWKNVVKYWLITSGLSIFYWHYQNKPA